MTFGLVLGGGGARGLAHLGVLRAMREAGVPVDQIGGTSQGAFVSAVWSLYDDPFDPIGSLSAVRCVVRNFAAGMSSTWGFVRDLTLPITSYFSGEGLNRFVVNALGAAKIEDLVTPMFCVTTDLYTSSAVIHRNGAMWKYVRASMSLTGYLPPVCDAIVDEHGTEVVHLLCDGGYVNNLPADVMRRELGASTIIAVDVRSETPFLSPNYGASLGGLSFLLRRLRAWIAGEQAPGDVPSMAAIASQLAFVSSEWQRDEARDVHADLYLRPAVQNFGLLQYAALSEIQRLGYIHATEELARWKRELRERGDPRCVVFDLADLAGDPRSAGPRRVASAGTKTGTPRHFDATARRLSEIIGELKEASGRRADAVRKGVDAVRMGLRLRRSRSFTGTTRARASSWDASVDWGREGLRSRD